MTDAELDLLIIVAKQAAERGWEVHAGDVGRLSPPGFVWLEIPIDNAHFNLTARLARASVGRMVEGLRGQPTFQRILCDHIIQGPLTWSVNVQQAACKAFARTLTESGFSPAVKQIVA